MVLTIMGLYGINQWNYMVLTIVGHANIWQPSWDYITKNKSYGINQWNVKIDHMCINHINKNNIIVVSNL